MYIEEGRTGSLGMWKYLIIPGGFFGLMVLNYLLLQLLNIDTEALLQQEIARKGEIRVLVELLIPLVAGLFILLFWVKYVHQQSIRSLTTSRARIDWKRVWFAFALWGALTAVLILIDVSMHPGDFQWNLDWSRFLPLLLIGSLLIPLQTSFEEYLFRGYLMQGLGLASGYRWVPLVFTSITFGLLHLGNPEVARLGYGIMVYYIGTGFFLGLITLLDEGLELALGFHAANNLVSALLVTANWTAFQTPSLFKDISQPVLGYDVVLPVFVLFPLLILVFAWRYGWKNWREKLFGRVS